MTITRYGKCDTCKKPIVVKRAFAYTINMSQRSGIPSDLAEQLEDWKQEPIFCEEHNEY